MAGKHSKSKPLVSFNQSISIDVHEPAFTPSDAVRHLDIKALSKVARAEVPIGEIDGGCCSHTVYVTIRKGLVTKVYAESCKQDDKEPLSREAAKMVKEAVRRARARRRGGTKLPVPVRDFFGGGAMARAITVETLRCIRICIFGGCITCCWRDDMPDPPVFCGRVIIDTTKPGIFAP